MSNQAAEGRVYGLRYSVQAGIKKPCMVCGRENEKEPLLVLSATERQERTSIICESCSVLASWIWTTTSAHAVSASAFPTDIYASTVLFLRDRPGDPANPYQVLTVERKDELGTAGLPGGKVEAREDPLDAAAREVFEETGLLTWASAMEPLYLGYSSRGRLVATYLCRAFYGVAQAKESPVGWRNAGLPSSNFLMGQFSKSHFAGYYKGLSLAAKTRVMLQRQMESKLPLSLQVSASASHYISIYLRALSGSASKEEESMLQGFRYAMTGPEAEVANFVIMAEERRLNLTPRGLPDADAVPRELDEEGKEEDSGEPGETFDGVRSEAPPFSG